MHFKLEFKPFPPPDGPLSCALVPWDSDTFGMNVYELKCGKKRTEELSNQLAAGLESLPADRACLVAARLAPFQTGIAADLARNGFYYAETMLDFELSLARLNPIIRDKAVAGRYCFRPAAPGDLQAARAMAQDAFAWDRFHLDENLPREKADLRYAQWVENSFRDGTSVFVLEKGEPPDVIGFIQCRDVGPGLVDLSFVALRRDVQNSGAGVLMCRRFFMEYQRRGYDRVFTHVSINNLRGVKLTLRYGFDIANATLIMHWFRNLKIET